jgi:hypothetical protein
MAVSNMYIKRQRHSTVLSVTARECRCSTGIYRWHCSHSSQQVHSFVAINHRQALLTLQRHSHFGQQSRFTLRNSSLESYRESLPPSLDIRTDRISALCPVMLRQLVCRNSRMVMQSCKTDKWRDPGREFLFCEPGLSNSPWRLQWTQRITWKYIQTMMLFVVSGTIEFMWEHGRGHSLCHVTLVSSTIVFSLETSEDIGACSPVHTKSSKERCSV